MATKAKKAAKMTVAILGCGPSGLIAAHACALKDVPFQVFSRPERSILRGSQYLHHAIPELISEDEGRPVHYINHGTPEEYRSKTFGKYWDGQAAPEEFETEHMAWNIRVAYDRLWSMYGHFTTAKEVTTHKDPELRKYDLVISTVPRTLFRQRGDEFIYARGWALNGPVANAHMSVYPDNTIVCDGRSFVRWTRASKTFGHCTIEWPDLDHCPDLGPGGKAVRIIKPLRCTVRRVPDRWLFVGRYGEWKKGVVVTDAWDMVNKALEEL